MDEPVFDEREMTSLLPRQVATVPLVQYWLVQFSTGQFRLAYIVNARWYWLPRQVSRCLQLVLMQLLVSTNVVSTGQFSLAYIVSTRQYWQVQFSLHIKYTYTWFSMSETQVLLSEFGFVKMPQPVEDTAQNLGINLKCLTAPLFFFSFFLLFSSGAAASERHSAVLGHKSDKSYGPHLFSFFFPPFFFRCRSQ